MDKSSIIYVAGHRGLVGSAILKLLKAEGYQNLIFRTHRQMDLTDQRQVIRFFQRTRPQYVFLAGAKVGGIRANNLFRADFLLENLRIQNNVIEAAFTSGVEKLLFLGSSCIYPKNSPQPIKESYLLKDELEYTNEPYALAKIAGIKLCESFNLQYGTNFISVMPSNLYGPGDNYHLENSHVIPAIAMKCAVARLLAENRIGELSKLTGSDNRRQLNRFLVKHRITGDHITLWGTGRPRREFLHSHDLAAACLFIMKHVDFRQLVDQTDPVKNSHINIGFGSDTSIKELAGMIASILNYRGTVGFDESNPDGTYQKLLDCSKLNSLGWKPEITLESGLRQVMASKFPMLF